MTIDFTRNADKLFTNVFYKVRAAQKLPCRFVVNYGGAGSSKSVSQHQSELINLLTCDYDILLMRKVAADIYDSCYKLLEKLAQDWGIYDLFTWNYSNEKRQIQNKITGHRIVFRGADDISKLKSIVGIGRVILEEADAFDISDFREINRRARGFDNIQVVFILNPVDEEHWIKTMFVDKPDGSPGTGAYHSRSHFIHSTYLDNQFIDDEFVKELLLLKDIDENEYNIYALGKWGRFKTGAEFYPHFKESTHTGTFRFVPHLPAHISYDFNVIPYMTLLGIQYIQEEEVVRFRVFKEYCLSSPLNTTTAVSETFVDDYGPYLKTVFYYGDASGNNRIAGKGDEVNFDDVRAALVRYLYDGSDRTSPSNKPVLKRRKLVLKALAGQLFLGKRKIVIEIDEGCKETIRDFKYLKLGREGKLKEIVENKKTKVKFQQFGHCFVGETMVTTIEGEKRIDEIKEGDYVLTRKGYKKVTGAHYNGIREVRSFGIGSIQITCTPDHKVWTEEKDFTEVGQLMQWNTFCIVDSNHNICKKKLFITTDIDLPVIQMPKKEVPKYIIQDGCPLMVNGKRKGYTGTNTYVKLAQYLKVIMCIMLTKIRSIMKYQIINASLFQNIIRFITKQDQRNPSLFKRQHSLRLLRKKQNSGINPQKEDTGIKNKQNQVWFANPPKEPVYVAHRHLSRRIYPTQSFVHTDAKMPLMQNWSVKGKNLQKVYDITVEGEHEYFANGILVHNCTDAFEYCFCQLFEDLM